MSPRPMSSFRKARHAVSVASRLGGSLCLGASTGGKQPPAPASCSFLFLLWTGEWQRIFLKYLQNDLSPLPFPIGTPFSVQPCSNNMSLNSLMGAMQYHPKSLKAKDLHQNLGQAHLLLCSCHDHEGLSKQHMTHGWGLGWSRTLYSAQDEWTFVVTFWFPCANVPKGDHLLFGVQTEELGLGVEGLPKPPHDLCHGLLFFSGHHVTFVFFGN